MLVKFDADFADLAGLFLTQQVTRAANIQIMRRQREAGAQIIQRLHHFQPLFRRRRKPMRFRPGEIRITTQLAAPNAPAQLIQLRQAKHIRTVNDQRIHRRHIQAAFNDIGGQQNIMLAIAKFGHDAFKIGRCHAAMRLHHARFRHNFREPFGELRHILNTRHHAENLPATEAFALNGFAQHHLVPRHDEGAHRQPIHRRGRNHAHLPHAGQRQLQRARNGGRGQR